MKLVSWFRSGGLSRVDAESVHTYTFSFRHDSNIPHGQCNWCVHHHGTMVDYWRRRDQCHDFVRLLKMSFILKSILPPKVFVVLTLVKRTTVATEMIQECGDNSTGDSIEVFLFAISEIERPAIETLKLF